MKPIATEENSNTAMTQMDFSKNFTCLYQDEVASAHMQTNSVTLFTVSERFFMVIVSDNKHHDKRTVVSFLLFLIM